MPDGRPNAVVAGTFADFKLVKSRSVAQLIIELPLEKAQDAIEMFGVPMPGAEIWVAVARLVAPISQPISKAPDPDKSRRGKEAYQAADSRTQAAMRAGRMRGDPIYWQFLSKKGLCKSKEEAAELQRAVLGVESSRDFQTDDAAYQRFLDHEHQFAVHQGREPEPR